MASWKAELFTIDGVMDYYSACAESDYIVYAGNRPEEAYIRYEHYGTKKEGEDSLLAGLQALQQSPMNTNVYLLQIIQKINPTAKKKIAKAKQITFQLNGGFAPGMQYPGQFMAGMQMPGVSADNKALNEKLDKLIELQTLQAANRQITNGDEDNKPNTMGEVMAGFLEREDVQAGAVGLMFGLAEKLGIAPPGTAAAAAAGASSSMGAMASDQDEVLSDAVERLKDVDPDLGHDLSILADLAQTDPGQFKMLIGALRAQKKK